MDLVFSCSVCQKPLRVEAAAAGKSIQCPICASRIQVPRVKTARVLGTFHAPATRMARQNRRVRALSEGARELGSQFASLARLEAERERDMALLREQAGLMRQQLELTLGELTARSRVAGRGTTSGNPSGSRKKKNRSVVAWALGLAAMLLAALALFLPG